MIYLKLSFISDAVSSQVIKFVVKHKLAVNVCLPQAENLGMFPVLRDPKINKNVGEQTAWCVTTWIKASALPRPYMEGKVCGETGRSAYDRLAEYLRYARNPTYRSYNKSHDICPTETFNRLQKIGIRSDIMGPSDVRSNDI